MWLCHSRPFLFSVGRAFGAALLLLYGCVTAIAFSPQAAPLAWLSPILLGGAGGRLLSSPFSLLPYPLSGFLSPQVALLARLFFFCMAVSQPLLFLRRPRLRRGFPSHPLLPLRGDSITASFPTTHKKNGQHRHPFFHPLSVLMLLCLLRMWLYHSHPYLSLCYYIFLLLCSYVIMSFYYYVLLFFCL